MVNCRGADDNGKRGVAREYKAAATPPGQTEPGLQPGLADATRAGQLGDRPATCTPHIRPLMIVGLTSRLCPSFGTCITLFPYHRNRFYRR
jgi:hypothetical protein